MPLFVKLVACRRKQTISGLTPFIWRRRQRARVLRLDVKPPSRTSSCLSQLLGRCGEKRKRSQDASAVGVYVLVDHDSVEHRGVCVGERFHPSGPGKANQSAPYGR